MAMISKIVNGRLVQVNVPQKTKAGRKPLPRESKRRMYSTRLHPSTISRLQKLKEAQGKPIARIIESLVSAEANRLGY